VRNGLSGVPGEYWTLSVMEFLFWFAMATSNYLTVFLQRSGLSPSQVGQITAANGAIAIFASPFWGMIADKLRSIRKVFLLCMSVAAVLWAAVPASIHVVLGPILLMHLLVPLSFFFRIPANSLMDAFVVQTCAREKVPYGNVRLWGSIGFAVMALSLSAILPWTGVNISFFMYGAAVIPLLIIMWRRKDESATKSVPFREMQFGRLFKNYYFLTYILFSIFLNMPMNTSFTFLPYLVDAVGGDTAQLGLLVGYKALLEIPMLLLMKPMRKRFPLPVIIVLAGVLYIAEFALYSRTGSFMHILLIQTLSGFANGVMIGSAANYVFSLAPAGLTSTAQTVSGAMSSISTIIGSLLGGELITLVGVRGFYMISAGLVAASLVYFLITLFIGIKILKKPLSLS
jgi:predicted MFS family arabinose efflux permease